MDLSSLSNTFVMWGFIILIIIVTSAICFLIVRFVRRQRRYRQFDVVIWRLVGGKNFYEYYDRGGIFVDKSVGKRLFWLKKNKVGMNPDNVPVRLKSNGKKVVYLMQTGLRNFRFVEFDIEKPNVNVLVGEEDVNWASVDYEKSKKFWQTSLFLQLLPFILTIFGMIIVLVIAVLIINKFDVLNLTSQHLQASAEALRNLNCSTYVLQS